MLSFRRLKASSTFLSLSFKRKWTGCPQWEKETFNKHECASRTKLQQVMRLISAYLSLRNKENHLFESHCKRSICPAGRRWDDPTNDWTSSLRPRIDHRRLMSVADEITSWWYEAIDAYRSPRRAATALSKSATGNVTYFRSSFFRCWEMKRVRSVMLVREQGVARLMREPMQGGGSRKMIDKGIIQKNLREIRMMMMMYSLREERRNRWRRRQSFRFHRRIRQEFLLEIFEEFTHEQRWRHVIRSRYILQIVHQREIRRRKCLLQKIRRDLFLVGFFVFAGYLSHFIFIVVFGWHRWLVVGSDLLWFGLFPWTFVRQRLFFHRLERCKGTFALLNRVHRVAGGCRRWRRRTETSVRWRSHRFTRTFLEHFLKDLRVIEGHVVQVIQVLVIARIEGGWEKVRWQERVAARRWMHLDSNRLKTEMREFLFFERSRVNLDLLLLSEWTLLKSEVASLRAVFLCFQRTRTHTHLSRDTHHLAVNLFLTRPNDLFSLLLLLLRVCVCVSRG